MTKLAQDDADIKQGHTELKRLAYQGWVFTSNNYLLCNSGLLIGFHIGTYYEELLHKLGYPF